MRPQKIFNNCYVRICTYVSMQNWLKDIIIIFRSSEEDFPPNSSATNENVTFREKRDYSQMGFNYMLDRSSIETTTEL